MASVNIPIKESYDTGKRFISDVVNAPGQIVRMMKGSKRRRSNTGGKQLVLYKAPKAMPGLYVKHQGKQIERKYIDTSWSGIRPSDVISTQLINGVEEGTGVGQRIGRRLENRTVAFRGYVSSPADFSIVKFRLLIVIDTQPNGTVLAAADLFENTTYPADSFYALKNRDRFKVIKDIQMYLHPTDSAKIHQFKLNFGVNFKKTMTTYASTGATINDIATNSIYAVTASSAPNAGGNDTKPILNTIFRYRYYDA